MEKYYESYILAEVNNEDSFLFSHLLIDDYQQRYLALERHLQFPFIPRIFTSIIDADIYLFGLIYYTIVEGKTISSTIERISSEIKEKVDEFKGNNKHTKSPSALKYLRSRIQASINIYRSYLMSQNNSSDEA
ncbi:hypothetical protein [Prevotella pallens]|uniref:Uncharacterized protein n=1 Tax=Prevotella pallens TaxID=60133 RepID=A0A379GAN9_9BACT|nr:hypothetical protein [Prevotella pallens]SUC38068.1 Uncharacterised protein [Prevotella pallens]